jgi:hypothetical protein
MPAFHFKYQPLANSNLQIFTKRRDVKKFFFTLPACYIFIYTGQSKCLIFFAAWAEITNWQKSKQISFTKGDPRTVKHESISNTQVVSAFLAQHFYL